MRIPCPEDTCLSALATALCQWPGVSRYCVAYSGGCDSHALLDALARLRPLPAALVAVHVQHGLHPEAEIWATHCQTQAAALDIPCQVLHLHLNPAPGASLEAVARAARYAALAEFVGTDLLILAHHADDQAETLLLQLLRGAGPAGLAAMTMLEPWQAGWRARPWLHLPRSCLKTYAQTRQLQWVDDPSNQSLRFDRNYMRHVLLPLLTTRWPGAITTLNRAAGWQAETLELLTQMAAQDLAQLAPAAYSLCWTTLRTWPLARQKQLLRYWLHQLGLPLPDANRLSRISTEFLAAAPDRQPWLFWPGAELRRYQDRLYAFPPLPLAPQTPLAWPDDTHQLALPPGCGYLRRRSVLGQGLAACHWTRAEIRWRHGGELFCQARQHQRLKHWLQARRLPPWVRARLPLLYLDGQLAAVADLALADHYRAGPDEPGWVLDWQRDARLE